jgi:Flp pilus assembly pilin Flp
MTFLTYLHKLTRQNLGLEHESEGQGLPEYALILFLVSVAAMGALSALGIEIKTELYDVILAMLPF